MTYLLLSKDVNLKKLPSPPLVYWQLGHKLDKIQYRELLTEAKSIMEALVVLDKSTQADIIRKWLRDSQKEHADFERKNSSKDVFDTNYDFNEHMSEVDRAKLDIVFLYNDLKPVFHTEIFLRALYSADPKEGSKFRINPTKGWPTKISFGFHSGPRTEPRSASFDKFSRNQLEVVLKWQDSKEPIKQLTPMTFGKMVDQIIAYEH